MCVTLDTSQLERLPLKARAQKNMRLISVTNETFHFETSPLNHSAVLNTSLRSSTPDTFHSAIDPLGPSAQSLSGKSLRLVSTAS